MKIKIYLLAVLSVMLYACGNDLDTQPDTVTGPDDLAGTVTATPPPTLPSGFNVATNLAISGSATDEADMSFGVNPVMSEDLAIKVEFSVKASGETSFTPVFSPYNDVVIPAYNQLSAFTKVRTDDFGICLSSYTLKMTVTEVRYDGQIVPATDYNVLGLNTDGSTEVSMTGPGTCPSYNPGPGYVSWKDYINGYKDIKALGDL